MLYNFEFKSKADLWSQLNEYFGNNETLSENVVQHSCGSQKDVSDSQYFGEMLKLFRLKKVY